MATIDLAYIYGLSDKKINNIAENAVVQLLLREIAACSNLKEQKKISKYTYCIKYKSIIKGSIVEIEGGIDTSLLTKEEIEEDSSLRDKLNQNIENTVEFALTEEIYNLSDLTEVRDRLAETCLSDTYNEINNYFGR